VKTKQPVDEAAPEQAAMGAMCNCTHTRGCQDRARLRTHRKEKKLKTMAFRALEKELKYIQDSLYLHIRYNMIRLKHVEGERQRMKEK
jgi:hypothetical protein